MGWILHLSFQKEVNHGNITPYTRRSREDGGLFYALYASHFLYKEGEIYYSEHHPNRAINIQLME